MNIEENKNLSNGLSEGKRDDNRIELVEVKAPQMPREITFPKEITFSGSDAQTESSFWGNDSYGVELTEGFQGSKPWTEYTNEKTAKKNWIPICIACMALVGLVAGFVSVWSTHPAEEENVAAVATSESMETEENMGLVEDILAQGGVEITEESSVAESSETADTAEESVSVEESDETEESVWGQGDDWYGVSYDSERAEEMLDKVQELYGQIPKKN